MNLIQSAVTTFFLMTLLAGVVYPLAMTAIAQLLLPDQANGSVVFHSGRPVGSSLIGQQFQEAKYFWGRLSATSPAPYQAAASSGSNFGPLNEKLKTAAEERIRALRAADPTAGKLVPVDLATASGSGLDPHISPAAAYYQAGRVARARGLPVEQVRALIDRHVEGRSFGLLGEPRVNVLLLNLALAAEENAPQAR